MDSVGWYGTDPWGLRHRTWLGNLQALCTGAPVRAQRFKRPRSKDLDEQAPLIDDGLGTPRKDDIHS